MGLVLFLVCLLASGIGSICGIGGGVIIKPVIDMQGIMSVNEASFLSGLTVMAMAMVNIIMRRKTKLLDMRIGSLLALGSVAGGVLGNDLLTFVRGGAGADALLGLVQAIALGLITAVTLLYTVRLKERLPTYHIHRLAAVVVIGVLLGVCSAFLGIGGGPINIHNRFFTAVKPGLKCPEGYSAPVCSYGTCAHGIGGYTRRACWKRNKQKDIYRDDK